MPLGDPLWRAQGGRALNSKQLARQLLVRSSSQKDFAQLANSLFWPASAGDVTPPSILFFVVGR